jgi:hypothetical protein
VLKNKFRIPLQQRSKRRCIAAVEQVYCLTERGVFDALIVAKVEAIRERWMFDVALQSRPAGKAVLTGDVELRVPETKRCLEDIGVRRIGKTGMEFANLLSGVGGDAQRTPLEGRGPGTSDDRGLGWMGGVLPA